MLCSVSCSRPTDFLLEVNGDLERIPAQPLVLPEAGHQGDPPSPGQVGPEPVLTTLARKHERVVELQPLLHGHRNIGGGVRTEDGAPAEQLEGGDVTHVHVGVCLGGGCVDREEGHLPQRVDTRVPGRGEVCLLTRLVYHVLSVGLRGVPKVPTQRTLLADIFAHTLVFNS